MTEGIKNFINSIRPAEGKKMLLAEWFLYAIFCFGAFTRVTKVERIIIGVLLGAYLLFIICFNVSKIFKSKFSRSLFHGLRFYPVTISILHFQYRMIFDGLHWSIAVLVLYQIAQTALWCASTFYNVKMNNYEPRIYKERAGLNIFLVASFLLAGAMSLAEYFFIKNIGKYTPETPLLVFLIFFSFIFYFTVTPIIKAGFLKKYGEEENIVEEEKTDEEETLDK